LKQVEDRSAARIEASSAKRRVEKARKARSDGKPKAKGCRVLISPAQRTDELIE
jgi:hypothetical protein